VVLEEEAAPAVSDPESKSDRLSLKDIEYKNMMEALSKTSGNISKAAKILGISRDTLYRRMRKHGVGLKT